MLKHSRRLAALFLAAGMMTVTPVVTSGVAVADQRVVTGGRMAEGTTADGLDPDFMSNLTLKKRASNPYDAVPEGELPPGPIAGVTFTIEKVRGVTVDSQAGYNAAKNYTVEQAREAGLIKIDSLQTNNEGEVVFEGLVAGLYLVTEVPPSDDRYSYKVSDPFLIILPLVNPEGTEFQHDNLIIVKDRVPDGQNDPFDEPEPDPDGENDPFDVPEPTSSPTPSGGVVPPGRDGGSTPPGSGTRTTSPTEPGSPSTGTPGQPGSGGAPGQPGSGGSTGDGSSNSPIRNTISRLAETGASVIGIALFGLALLVAGFILLLKRRREEA